MGSTGSGPWGLVVEWFWLVHDEQSGKSLLSPTQTGLGLSAGLLAELVLANYVTISNDQVLATARRPPPEVLAHQVFSLVWDEPEPLTLSLWLTYLARTVREDIGTQLQRRGLVEGRRSWFRRERCWVPVDVNVSGRPESRLRTAVAGQRDWSATEVLLAGLSEATGLLESLLKPTELHRVRAQLPQLLERVSPEISVILDQTRVAMSTTVLTDRR